MIIRNIVTTVGRHQDLPIVGHLDDDRAEVLLGHGEVRPGHEEAPHETISDEGKRNHQEETPLPKSNQGIQEQTLARDADHKTTRVSHPVTALRQRVMKRKIFSLLGTKVIEKSRQN